MPLLEADRSLFAWEWLRRSPDYCRACSAGRESAASPLPEAFGLVAFENPELPVPVARPLWSIEAHPLVLAVERGGPGASSDRLDCNGLSSLVRLVRADRADHLLLSDGRHAVRLDGPPGTFCRPAVLRYRIAGLASAERPLTTLRRLLSLCRTGRFARSLHPPEARASRWILQLRAWDAIAAGADQRTIAATLLSRSAGAPSWRNHEPSLRSQVQRLVRSARMMRNGGYRRLLA